MTENITFLIITSTFRTLQLTSGTVGIDAIPEKLDLVVTLTLQRNGLSEWMRLSSHFVWLNADFFVLLPP